MTKLCVGNPQTLGPLTMHITELATLISNNFFSEIVFNDFFIKIHDNFL